MMTSAFLSTLSFNAEQNCAQNSGAKRRDDIKCLIMAKVLISRRHVTADERGSGQLEDEAPGEVVAASGVGDCGVGGGSHGYALSIVIPRRRASVERLAAHSGMTVEGLGARSSGCWS